MSSAVTSSAATSSAIWAVFSAAPLRRLSPQTNRSSVFGKSRAWRSRPTKVGSVPTTSAGVGNSLAAPGRRRATHAGRLDQDLRARRRRLDRALEDRVHGERVRGDDRHAHAGGRDLQVGQAEDLARLVADLQLLAGPAVVLERARPRHDVEGQRRREGRRPSPSLSPTARRTSPALGPSDRSPRRPRARRAACRCRPGRRRTPPGTTATTSSRRPYSRSAGRRARRSSTASCSSGWR